MLTSRHVEWTPESFEDSVWPLNSQLDIVTPLEQMQPDEHCDYEPAPEWLL